MMPLFEAKVPLYVFLQVKNTPFDEMCLFMRGKCLFVSLKCLFVRHNCLFVKHNCLFLRHNRVFVGKVKLRTYLSRNFNLRTSEAHFIKKSALRGTAATCDSLTWTMGKDHEHGHGPCLCGFTPGHLALAVVGQARAAGARGIHWAWRAMAYLALDGRNFCMSGSLGFQPSPRSTPRFGWYRDSRGTICMHSITGQTE